MRLLFFLFILLTSINSLAQTSKSENLLIDTTWLKEQLGQPEILVVDVRSPEDYLKGHILGAINFPVDSTFDQKNSIGFLAPVSVIQNLLNQKGITNDKHLVLYDNGDFINAARLFWVFEIFGHQKTSILNLGYKSWEKSGNPISTAAHELQPNTYIPSFSSDRLATAFSTRLAIEDNNKTIVDVRPLEEYLGKKSKAMRYGHIPNAINIPWEEVIQKKESDPTIVDQNDLEKIYSQIDKNSRVITYCNKGKQSALTYFILRNLGYDVAAYDGSWSEWGNDSTLPIINPSKPDSGTNL